LVYEENEIIDIIVIIHIRSYLSTAMDRTWQSAEYDSWFVAYHHDYVDRHHREQLLQDQKERTLNTGIVTMIICIIVINVFM
jgi:hypothetical protein